MLAGMIEEADAEFGVRRSRTRRLSLLGGPLTKPFVFLALSPPNFSCSRGNAISVVSKKVALPKRSPSRRRIVGGVCARQEGGTEEGWGSKLRWFGEDSAGQFRGLRTGRLWFEARRVGSVRGLEPTKDSCFTSQATRQGWRSCLV
jgi:hypothetical protein